MQLSFTDVGNGKPIVLIHGFPLTKEMWRAQADLLTANGFRVILVDLPGFGENKPSSAFYSIEEMAAQIAKLLESLKIKSAIFGGLSMGGYVLLDLFHLFPEKCSALILCDTTYLADTEEKKKSRFELISKIEKQGATALIETMLPNLISEDTKQNNPVLVADLKEIFSKVNPVSAVNALQSMAKRKDNSATLVQISVPTLLLFGEFDKVTNLENERIMNQMISESEQKKKKKAGHFSNLEQPEQFNKGLLNFCRRIV